MESELTKKVRKLTQVSKKKPVINKGKGGTPKKSILTPSQTAFAVEKLKIANERQAKEKQARNNITKFKVAVAKKRARVGSSVTRRPSRAEVINTGLSFGKKASRLGKKEGRKLGKSIKKRVKKRSTKSKGSGYNAHVRKLEKLNYL